MSTRALPVTPRAFAKSTAHDRRIQAIFDRSYEQVARRTDRLLALLMLGTWIVSIGFAYWFSPTAWAGKVSVVHGHVYAAIFIGGAISSLPVALAYLRPGHQSTRYVIASGQVLWSALLIHLTGGRIETHFHIFGSLAIIAFYRDLKVLIPATVLVAADHFIRGIYWPESVYGVVNPEWWRFLEHAGWVVFIDVFLVINCISSCRELWELSAKQAETEESRQKVVLAERLAAVGKLSEGIGQQLSNMLKSLREAHGELERALREKGAVDAGIQQHLSRIRGETEAGATMASNLIDFAGTAQPERRPCPLRALVAEVLEQVNGADNVTLVNDVPEDLPVPSIDAGQMRQALIHLVQNGIDAIPPGDKGRVGVWARGGGTAPWILCVEDNGWGVPDDMTERVFEPLYTTKPNGTGLGLSIVSTIVDKHDGELSLDARKKGTKVTIILPPQREAAAAE